MRRLYWRVSRWQRSGVLLTVRDGTLFVGWGVGIIRVSKIVLAAVLAVSIVATTGISLLLTHQFELSAEIDSTQVQHEAGYAFTVAAPTGARSWLSLPMDGPGKERQSTLKVFENGNALGPPHSSHNSIRRVGSGGFSHWGDYVYFSASDDSDPRSNGRRYTVSAQLELIPLLWWCAAITLAAILAGYIALALLGVIEISSRIGIERLLAAALAVSIAATTAISLLLTHQFELSAEIDSTQVQHEAGYAFTIAAPIDDRSWLSLPMDGPGKERQSTLQIFENGNALGPPHSSHNSIRQVGSGGFSHWGDYVNFSASDNSDPRSNGRRYTVSAQLELSPPLWWCAAITLAAILAGYIALALLGVIEISSRIGIERQAPLTEHRGDIDGLRAIAVALVVLFHLGFQWVRGGYVGVDIFFVISGYLIVGQIARELDAGTFSIARFYQRRMRRIFPALFVTVGVALALGFPLLPPGDYVIAAESARYAVIALSNFYFLFNTGYFDAQADLMPLLHTWSLGVEEQFYLVSPALLLGVYFLIGRNRRWVVSTLLVATVFSFAANMTLIGADPKAVFYMPYTRAWEFCAGALFSLVTVKRIEASKAISEAAAVIGIMLIASAAFLFDIHTPFPGLAAALPVIGAALLIAPFQNPGQLRYWLAKQPFRWIGDISYSLYLWHWPTITLYRHYNLDRDITTPQAAALLIVIVPISWMSWRYIESPFRKYTEPAWRSIGKGIATASILFLASVGIIVSGGFPGRMPASAEPYESLRVMTGWTCPQDREILGLDHVCILGADWDRAKAHGFLIGDSHAEHFAPLLDIAARQAGISLIHTYWDCMPLIGTTSIRRYAPDLPAYNKMCADLYRPVIDYIQKHDDISLVAVAAAWSGYSRQFYKDDPPRLTSARRFFELVQDGIDELVTNLGASNRRKIIIISDVARRNDIALSCLTNSVLPLHASCPSDMLLTPLNAQIRNYQPEINDLIRALPSRDPDILTVIPQDAQCDPSGCRTSVNGEFLYRDTSHFRLNLSEKAKAELVMQFHLRDALELAGNANLKAKKSISAPDGNTN
jgi:peptidoglycan/LPS O-acetylase OafA/YrhL